MAKLPRVSGRQAVRAFERAGWILKRRAGSHMVLSKPGRQANLSVPDHPELAPGTLRRLIRDARLTVQEFVESL